jgi:hypothetical protein
MCGQQRRRVQIIDRLPAWARRALRVEVILAATLVLVVALFAWYQLATRLVQTD